MTSKSCRSLGLLSCLVLIGCGGGGKTDPDVQRREEWLRARTELNKDYLRASLNGTDDIQFYDGWFNVERDPSTAGAWRWGERRAVVRLRTKPGGATRAQDMELRVFGWVAHDHAALRLLRVEFAVNGHVLGRFDPPAKAFEHVLFVPRALLERGDWVDFTITVANATRTKGDWRDLGFATTGFLWKPAPPG